MLAKIILICKLIGSIFTFSSRGLSFAIHSRIHRFTYHGISEPRKIVIIGASFAGYQAACLLANSVPTGYQVVIIEQHSHFNFTWVFPRFCVVEGHEHKALVPYGSFLSKVPRDSYHWIRGTVSKIVPAEHNNDGYVELETGEQVAFAYLLIATGSSASAPSRLTSHDKTNAMQELRDLQNRIKTAQNILVLGGGPAGIEIAADAKAQYPEKTVTLAHSRPTLLNSKFGSRLHSVTVEKLNALGVDLILGERLKILDEQSFGEVELTSGEKIPYDCLIKCIGQKPNSELIQAISPASITATRHIKTLPTLQLADPTLNNIFAAGDVAERNEARNGRSASEQAHVVAQNIVRTIKGKPLLTYNPQWWEAAIKLTLGLDKNVIYATDGCAELTIPTASKEITLDSARIWKYFGVNPFDDPLPGMENKS